MLRKISCLVLVIVLLFSMTATVFAAGDAVFSQNTSFQYKSNKYNDVVVKSGVTVTLKNWSPEPQGLEITGKLTVEPGAKITGGLLIFYRGSSYEGMDLYYKVAGKEVLLRVSMEEFLKFFPSDYNPSFWYNTSTGHYVVGGNGFSNDPFGGYSSAGSENTAESLKSLGLFIGNENGFELDRVPTRVEEVIMLIRLLGKEDEAKNGSWSHPFTDVPSWADCYIGYAYENNLASGISADKFGTSTPATAQMFSTFVLRALGYSDDTKGGNDFTYSGANEAAMEHGLLRSEDEVTYFNRGICVNMMEAALRQSTKDGVKLWSKLADEGVFDAALYEDLFVNNSQN